MSIVSPIRQLGTRNSGGDWDIRKLSIIALLVIGVIVGVGVYLLPNSSSGNVSDTTPTSEVGISIGERAPNFSLSTFEGENLSLRDLRGKVVILDFMATGCPYCRDEIDHLKEVKKKFENSEITIVSIGTGSQEDKSDLKKFKLKHDASWIFSRNPQQGIQYRVKSLPKIYVLDENGIIQFKKEGLTKASVLSPIIENSLGKK